MNRNLELRMRIENWECMMHCKKEAEILHQIKPNTTLHWHEFSIHPPIHPPIRPDSLKIFSVKLVDAQVFLQNIVSPNITRTESVHNQYLPLEKILELGKREALYLHWKLLEWWECWKQLLLVGTWWDDVLLTFSRGHFLLTPNKGFLFPTDAEVFI